jgi:hypothetical protein
MINFGKDAFTHMRAGQWVDSSLLMLTRVLRVHLTAVP